jgi:hypothetical protein
MVEIKRIDQMIVVYLKEGKWIGVVLGAWIFLKNSQDFLGFVT